MENQNRISQEKFKKLIFDAKALLYISPQEFKDRYNELIRHIDKKKTDNTIEIRPYEDEITINCLIDTQNKCTDVYFFFDKAKEENAFIDHLVECVDYSFRKGAWLLEDCIIKTREMDDILSFHFYR